MNPELTMQRVIIKLYADWLNEKRRVAGMPALSVNEISRLISTGQLKVI
jgi:hypothetical protein